MTSQFDNNNNQLIFQMSGVEITTPPTPDEEPSNSTTDYQQRPTATQPIDIPQPKAHSTHTFDRIEAIFI
jgi:hypothetical protein